MITKDELQVRKLISKLENQVNDLRKYIDYYGSDKYTKEGLDILLSSSALLCKINSGQIETLIRK